MFASQNLPNGGTHELFDDENSGHSRSHVAAIGLLLGAAACSSEDKPARRRPVSPGAVQFALSTSSLPTCGSSQDGAVYYVWSDSCFTSAAPAPNLVQTNLND